MRKITFAVDETLLGQARAFAAGRGTTIAAMLRSHLRDLAGEDARLGEARRGLLELIDNSTGRLGPNFKWSRAAIYGDGRED
jgi:hypothetical protein